MGHQRFRLKLISFIVPFSWQQNHIKHYYYICISDKHKEYISSKYIMSEINIEIYTDIYKRDVANLIVGIQKNVFGIPINLDEQPDLKEIPGVYQINNGNFWIATVDKIVIGTIGLLYIGSGRGALRKMFVKKEHRGKEFGVGQGLLNTLLAWARQKGFSEIFLGTTEKFIAAHRFYEKNGFIPN
jgi:GNAT superfamily N-acetyltransferase